MKQNNLIKLLIPIVAVVVVVESIVLVSSLNKNNNTSTNVVTQETKEITEKEVNTEPVADFIFETETKEMKVGKPYEVNLNLVGKRTVNLDAMEIYVKYDPEKMTVTKLVNNKNLPQQVTKNSGIDSKKGMISSMFLWDIGESGLIKADETSSVLSFVVTPKVAGEAEISLNTGTTDKESVTMIVESSTSKSLNFLGNKLEINVTK